MNLQEFIQKYNGKGVDFDGYYGFQCMDLYQQYNKEVVGGPHIPANASEVWSNYPKDLYTKIENEPNNFPNLGDVVIWNNQAGGGFGHIAVCVDANSSFFTSFDQNWPPGSVSHLQSHNYNNVLGWLRPKTLSGIIEDMPQYLQTLLQENGLDLGQESQVREFFQQARDYHSLRVDKENCDLAVRELQESLKDALRKTSEAPISGDLSSYSTQQLLIAVIKKIFT